MLPLQRLENLMDLILDFIQSKTLSNEIGQRYSKFDPQFPGIGPCYRSGLSLTNSKFFNLEFSIAEHANTLIVYENLEGDVRKIFLKSVLCVLEISETTPNSDLLKEILTEISKRTFELIHNSAIEYQQKVHDYEKLRLIINL